MQSQQKSQKIKETAHRMAKKYLQSIHLTTYKYPVHVYINKTSTSIKVDLQSELDGKNLKTINTLVTGCREIISELSYRLSLLAGFYSARMCCAGSWKKIISVFTLTVNIMKYNKMLLIKMCPVVQ